MITRNSARRSSGRGWEWGCVRRGSVRIPSKSCTCRGCGCPFAPGSARGLQRGPRAEPGGFSADLGQSPGRMGVGDLDPAHGVHGIRISTREAETRRAATRAAGTRPAGSGAARGPSSSSAACTRDPVRFAAGVTHDRAARGSRGVPAGEPAAERLARPDPAGNSAGHPHDLPRPVLHAPCPGPRRPRLPRPAAVHACVPSRASRHGPRRCAIAAL